MVQIDICELCEGQGTLETRHHRDGYEKVSCSKCDGTGRVQKVTYSFQLPFGKTLDPKLDEQIFNLIKSASK